MTKLIVFDLMGVTFTQGHIISRLLYKMLPKSRKDLDFIKKKDYLYNEGKINDKEFWESIVGHNYKKLEKEYLDSFKLDPSYKSIVKYLNKKYKLAILSNLGAYWAHYLIHKFKFNKNFDHIVVSGDVKATKPHYKIYRILKKKSKINFKQMVFIDDKPKNLRSASKLGINTIWYKKEKKRIKFEPDHVINSLGELKNIL